MRAPDLEEHVKRGHGQPRPSRPRLLAPDWINVAFTAVLAIATVALVWASIKQHGDAVEAIEATRRTTSAQFVMKLDEMLNDL
jgi:hypothetical protein